MNLRAKKAIIYVRVSSESQRDQGSGLESQAHRCRQYAEARGLEVDEIFSDFMTGAGNPMKRPGMLALLRYLKKRKAGSFVVIVDDLKRFARDTRGHWELRDALRAMNVEVASPNYNFDESPEGEFVETVFAAQGQLERKQNRRQVIQKMTARIEAGYWTMYAPAGYRYEKAKGSGGKVLVRDEPDASIVQEALEGYASGRFQLLVDVIAFLESHPEFKLTTNGKVHPQNVSSMLRRVIYAGMVERPEWGIERRKGKHEGLISFETFQPIQERIDGNPLVAHKKSRYEDFPLRGFIICGDCGGPLTSCWAKGRNERHPYYHCHTKHCASYGKSIRRAVLEGEFDNLIRTLQPDETVFGIASAMFKDAWGQRAAQSGARRRAFEAEREGVNKAIEQLLDTITQVRSPAVLASFEQRIEKLENQKLVLQEKIEAIDSPRVSFDNALRTALVFLQNPWKLWTFGTYEHKKLLLQLCFSKRVAYQRNVGLRTAELALPFKLLDTLRTGEKENGGWGWIRTSVLREGRFTVCCH